MISARDIQAPLFEIYGAKVGDLAELTIDLYFIHISPDFYDWPARR